MANHFLSPTHLNTFTTAQGRVLKKGAMNQSLRDKFVNNFYQTTTHKRHKQHENDKIEAGELLRKIAILSTGLTVEFFDALPESIIEPYYKHRSSLPLPREYVEDPEHREFLRKKRLNIYATFPKNKKTPYSIFLYSGTYSDSSQHKQLPTHTPELDEAVTRLKQLINSIASFICESHNLKNLLVETVNGCRTIKQLCEMFVSAEDYFTSDFYAQTPGVPGVVILPKDLRHALSNWAQ